MQAKNTVTSSSSNDIRFIKELHDFLLELPMIKFPAPEKQAEARALMTEVTALLKDTLDSEKLFSIMKKYLNFFKKPSSVFPETNLNLLQAIIQNGLNGIILFESLTDAENNALKNAIDTYAKEKHHENKVRNDGSSLTDLRDLLRKYMIPQIFQTFPGYIEPLFKQILENTKGFKSLFFQSSFFRSPFLNLVTDFPDHSVLLIKTLISNPVQYHYLVSTMVDYLDFIERVKHYDVVEFIPSVVLDKAEFKRLILDHVDFIKLVTVRPEEAPSLIAGLLSDEVEFKRLIPNLDALKVLIEKLPNFAHELINIPFAGDIYRHLVPNFNAFRMLTINFSGTAVFVARLMSHDDEFKRMIDLNSVKSLQLAYNNPHFLNFLPQLLERSLDGCFRILKDFPREPLLNFIKKLDKAYVSERKILGIDSTGDSLKFLYINKEKIFELYALFGKAIFGFLHSKLANTPHPISRFFSSYCLLNQSAVNFYSNLMKGIQPSKKEINQLAEFFSHISELDNNKIEELHAILSSMNFKRANKLITFLYDHCLIIFLNEIGINTTELKQNDLIGIKEKLSVDKFLLLLKGLQGINESKRAFMLETLKADLDPSCTFKHFAYSTTDNTTIGLALAKHNLHCFEKLKSMKIDPNLALNYPYKKTISYGKNINETYFIQCKQLLTLIARLKKMSLPVDKFNLKQVIDNYRMQLLRGLEGSFESPTEAIFKRMNKNSYLDLLKKIANVLEKLIAENKKMQATHEANATTDLDVELKKLQTFIADSEKAPTTSPAKKNKFKSFEIKHWNKNEFDTLFLGEYLSCCLAPDGGRFSSMFMRRGDQDCFMHVITNAEGEPVCGNWLYFAHDINNPENVYVVANFVDIRISHCFDEELKQFLYTSLCHFTKEFANQVNAKDYIIRRFPDGVFHKYSHPVIRMKIIKMGGFFDLDTLTTREEKTQTDDFDGMQDTSFYIAPDLPSEYSFSLEKIVSPESSNLSAIGFFSQNKTENAANLAEQAVPSSQGKLPG
jgi:hypothetical protein